MSEDGAGEAVGRWRSVGVDMRERDEVYRGMEMDFERHLAVRRNGDSFEFAHIWVAKRATLEEGSPHRTLVDSITVPAASIDATMKALDRKLDLPKALLAQRDELAATVREIVEGAAGGERKA